jgi:hypothetical protein
MQAEAEQIIHDDRSYAAVARNCQRPHRASGRSMIESPPMMKNHLAGLMKRLKH